MSGFRVLELVATGNAQPAARWVLDDRTGLYELKLFANNQVVASAVPKGFYDILLSSEASFKVHKVLCTTNNNTFNIGNRVTYGNNTTGSITVTSFVVKQNRVYINGTFLLSDVRMYVEPTVTITNTVTGGTNNFVELEERIVRGREALKLGSTAEAFVNPTQSLDSFLTNFFLTYNNRYNTYYVNSNRSQTPAGRRRSLGDIFMICKTYYPTCNLHDVIKALYVTLPAASGTRNLGSLICSQINKRVWWMYTNPRFDHGANTDEYGHNRQWYIDNLNRVPEPVREVVAETADTEDDIAIFDRIKSQFPVGTVFRSMTTRNKEWRVDSDNFYNGIKSIILVQRDGSRKQVYDKVARRAATIVR